VARLDVGLLRRGESMRGGEPLTAANYLAVWADSGIILSLD
jgi:hypothetical protein